jgi:FkbH-like protein
MFTSLKFSEIIEQSKLLEKEVSKYPIYKISILSNSTINQLKEILVFCLRKNNINAIVDLGSYDNIVQDSYNISSSDLTIIHYDIIPIIDNLDVFVEDMNENEFLNLTDSIKLNIDTIVNNLSSIPTLVFNTFLPDIFYSSAIQTSKVKFLADEINKYLYSLNFKNLTIFNFQNTIYKLGRDASFDNRLYYLSKNPYTISVWKEYANQIAPLIYKNNGLCKKAVIFDCDNTLWKGILGEDGFDGIDMSRDSKIGQIYNRIQQLGVWLSSNGIIIGLCSKNNSEEVINVVNNHSDMLLRSKLISVYRINWTDKATNLREIAKELNIGLDSIVFIDDSSFEINLINQQLPEVLTLQVPKAIHDYPTFFYNLIESSFYFSNTIDDKMKTQQYKEQNIRSQEKEKFQTLTDFLISLNLEVEVFINNITQIERIAQLTQKTNQFNLTTIRYTENQISMFMNDDAFDVFSFSVNDKFGQSGLTAVVIVNKTSNYQLIDTFLMSCRIMGRDIEKAVLNYIMNYYKSKDVNLMRGKYTKTNKNIPVHKFYEDARFEIIYKNDNTKEYQIKLDDYIPFNTNFIKIKHG